MVNKRKKSSNWTLRKAASQWLGEFLRLIERQEHADIIEKKYGDGKGDDQAVESRSAVLPVRRGYVLALTSSISHLSGIVLTCTHCSRKEQMRLSIQHQNTHVVKGSF